MSTSEHAGDPVALAKWTQANAPGFHLQHLSVSEPGLPVTAIPFLVAPSSAGPVVKGLRDIIDQWRTHPMRRRGTAQLQDLASFISHVARFQDAGSAIFADGSDPSHPVMLAVLDYHEAVNRTAQSPALLTEQEAAIDLDEPRPRFGIHRARYAFPLSDEWKAWTAQDGKPMTQAAFAEFLEDRLGDVLAPPTEEEVAEAARAALDARTEAGGMGAANMMELAHMLGGRFASPAKLLDLSRGLAVHNAEKAKSAVNLSSGEVQIQYEAAHQAEGGGPIQVPNLFMIGVPVFRAGAPYRIAVRLRYRLRDGTVSWHYQLYRLDLVFDHAFREAADEARMRTGLPLFFGTPEG